MSLASLAPWSIFSLKMLLGAILKQRRTGALPDRMLPDDRADPSYTSALFRMKRRAGYGEGNQSVFTPHISPSRNEAPSRPVLMQAHGAMGGAA